MVAEVITMEPGQTLAGVTDRAVLPRGSDGETGALSPGNSPAGQLPASDPDDTIGHVEHLGVSTVAEVITMEPGQTLAGVTDREVLPRGSDGETGALPPSISPAGQWPASDAYPRLSATGSTRVYPLWPR